MVGFLFVQNIVFSYNAASTVNAQFECPRHTLHFWHFTCVNVAIQKLVLGRLEHAQDSVGLGRRQVLLKNELPFDHNITVLKFGSLLENHLLELVLDAMARLGELSYRVIVQISKARDRLQEDTLTHQSLFQDFTGDSVEASGIDGHQDNLL